MLDSPSQRLEAMEGHQSCCNTGTPRPLSCGGTPLDGVLDKAASPSFKKKKFFFYYDKIDVT